MTTMTTRDVMTMVWVGLVAALAMGLGACGDSAEEGSEVDSAALARARAAIPSAEQLQASAPGGMAMAESGLREQALVGELALYPQESYPIVLGVNSAVGDMVTLLKTVTGVPPTIYNSETQEFLWGPWPYEGSVGNVAVYIKENPPGEDFAYVYAFVRLMDNDLGGGSVVIWGGSNPDPDGDETRGSGLTLWDFEANHAFEAANNPAGAPEASDRGRFLALYGKGPSADDPEAEVTTVLAAFRGFVPSDNPGAEPADADYYYGQVATAEHTVDFLNYALTLDIDDGDGDPNTQVASAPELLDVKMVFLDQGRGRAEAIASGGDIADSPEIDLLEVVECWDEQIKETYLGMTAYGDDGSEIGAQSLGDPSGCAPIFDNSIDALMIPTLDDVDPTLKAQMDALATGGVQ